MADTLVGAAPIALILGSLAIMASRTFTPVRAMPEGRVEYELPLGFVQRTLAQKANVLSILALIALGGGILGTTRWLPPMLSYVALLATLAMLLKPQKVVFTSAGVLLHNAAFRKWKDFDSFGVSGNRVVLQSPVRLSSVNVFVSYKRRAEVERIVRRHLRSPKTQGERAVATSRSRRSK
jgi:hypothetical protein